MPIDGSHSCRVRRWWVWTGAALAAIAATTAGAYLTGLGLDPPAAEPARDATPAPEAARHPRLFYWSATTNDNELKWRSKIDWAQKMDFAGAPIRRDIIIIYGQFLGKYPRFGLHQVQKPGRMDEHLKQVHADVQRQIPAGFTGLVCIDYESWGLLWDRLVNEPSVSRDPDAEDADLKDDWRDHTRATAAGWSSLTPEQQEQLCKATYERAARDFFLKTLAACKTERPEARWGFFDYPSTLYVGPETGGRIGYNEQGEGLSAERNDQLRWLFDAVDVLFPAPYAVAETVPESALPSWASGTNSIEENRRYVYTNVLEAVRLAKGKPVVSYMWPRYQRVGSPLHRRFLNDVNLRQCLELPFEAGADGVAMWESVDQASDFPALQEYVRDKIAPLVIELSGKPR